MNFEDTSIIGYFTSHHEKKKQYIVRSDRKKLFALVIIKVLNC